MARHLVQRYTECVRLIYMYNRRVNRGCEKSFFFFFYFFVNPKPMTCSLTASSNLNSKADLDSDVNYRLVAENRPFVIYKPSIQQSEHRRDCKLGHISTSATICWTFSSCDERSKTACATKWIWGFPSLRCEIPAGFEEHKAAWKKPFHIFQVSLPALKLNKQKGWVFFPFLQFVTCWRQDD